MTYQPIAISKELHQKVKLAATKEGLTMIAWTETALRRALDGKRVESASMLVDPSPAYETQEAK
jgi:hypothetical protein